MKDSGAGKLGPQSGAAKKPPTRPALQISFIEEHQRRRVVGAVAELAHQSGIGAVTAERLAQIAHMGKGTFYARFGSQAGCLSYAFAVAYQQVFAELASAAAGSGPWPARLDDGLAALCEACAAEPLLAELCLSHAAGAPAAAAGHEFEAAAQLLTTLLAGGRLEGRIALGAEYREPPGELEELLARGILSLVRQQILRGAAAGLPAMREEIFLWSAGALLGPEEAGHAWRQLGDGRPARAS